MQSDTPKESSSSVVLKYTDPERVCAAVEEFAASLRKNYPHIRMIYWFGSWVNGTFSAGSDVDICIVVSESELRRHERTAEFLPNAFPVGMDLHVYTVKEFESLHESAPELYAAITAGRLL